MGGRFWACLIAIWCSVVKLSILFKDKKKKIQEARKKIEDSKAAEIKEDADKSKKNRKPLLKTIPNVTKCNIETLLVQNEISPIKHIEACKEDTLEFFLTKDFHDFWVNRTDVDIETKQQDSDFESTFDD